MASPTHSGSFAENLYSGFQGGYDAGHILPIRQLTREHIEKELDSTQDTRLKMRKVVVDPFRNRTIGLDSQGNPIHNITLNTRPPGSLYSDNEEDTVRETPSYRTQNGRLQLLRYPPVSLYDFDQPVITEPSPVSIYLDVEKYSSTRQQVMDEFGGMWTAGSMHVDQAPVVQQSPSHDQHTMDHHQPQSADQQVPTTDTIPSSSVDQSQHHPVHWVPVYATPFQQSSCDEFYTPNPVDDVLSAKVDFNEIIARLNHPLEAMVDDYDVTADDKWNGSGKTQFIRDFIKALNEAQVVTIWHNDLNKYGNSFS